MRSATKSSAGQFGRPVINAARAELRQDDATVATAEAEIEAL